MRKLPLLLVLICYHLLATTTTTVTQTMIGADSKAANGVVTISIPVACSSTLGRVGQQTVTVPFLNGAFTVDLVPSTGCGTITPVPYSVGWLMCSATATATRTRPCPSGGASWTEVWNVPASSSPVSVTSVVVSTAVIPAIPLVNISQISLSGATPGQTLCATSQGWVPGACGAGGGVDGTSTWLQLETGVAGSGSITGSTTWSQIEGS